MTRPSIFQDCISNNDEDKNHISIKTMELVGYLEDLNCTTCVLVQVIWCRLRFGSADLK